MSPLRTAPARGRGAGSAVRHYTAPMQEMKFLLNDVYDVESHYKSLKMEGAESATPEMVDMILNEMAKFSENTLAPLNWTADAEGCVQTGPNEVKTPTGFKEAYDEFAAGGWQGLSYPEEYGGQGLPTSLAVFSSEMCATANWAWTMYPGLSKGAINTIMVNGSEALKEKYMEKMVAGEWTGTMCLTEPQCGSDLNQVKTKAEPIGDGKFKITGTKIFISCGEHDLTENIVHCVLARLPGAPAGTRGISLFAVPKRDLETGELNGAPIGRIEDKMGCHGSSTCEINFEGAVGELIGTENKGMSHMFTFINTSRLGTAIQGLAAAELSYQNALAYCRERVSMRALSGTKHPELEADPIICHPTVRTMLLTQKAVAEAGRSMVYECAVVADKMEDARAQGDDALAKKYDEQLAFLTPTLKGFLTEMGVEAANHGIQLYGGHGYIKSNKQEQVLRDVRISSVWEGTTQIQALDLLGRKIMLQKLKPINEHCMGLYKYAGGLAASPPSSQGAIRSHAAALFGKAAEWQLATYRIAARAASDKEAIGSASEAYLMYAGYVTMAEHWLRMEVAAAKALDAGAEGEAKEYYEAKLATAAFYFENMLPRTKLHHANMFTNLDTIMDERHFKVGAA